MDRNNTWFFLSIILLMYQLSGLNSSLINFRWIMAGALGIKKGEIVLK